MLTELLKYKVSNDIKKYLILYSHNGDILLNMYLNNDKKIDKNIIDYYRTKYSQVFKKYTKGIMERFFYDNEQYIKSFIDTFYKYLRKAIILSPLDIIVYRGISYIDSKDIKLNSFIKYKSYLSTSLSKIAGSNFAVDNGILLEILINKNTPIIPILFNSVYPEEQEILLPDNSILFILDKKKEKLILKNGLIMESIVVKCITF